MRKRIYVIGLVTIAIAVAACVMLVLLPKPGITKVNFARIQVGMKEAEVDAILGDSSITYITELNGPLDPKRFKTWKSYDCEINVALEDGRVMSSDCGPGYEDNRTAWQRLMEFANWRESNNGFPPPPPH